MATLTLKSLTKTYVGSKVPSVAALNLDVQDGEFLVLVGPSGCGKSTALKMIAGLEEVSSGEVIIGDRLVNTVASRDRDIAMVFQSYALYPHMSVFDNIAFPLSVTHRPKAEIESRVMDVARILQLEPYLKRKPGGLSGGQRQRVAMGRAIIRRPAIFLMDEPLSNLDAKLRVQMRSEIAQIQRRLKVTTIYVTHDQVEAMTMGDRVALLRDGMLQQVATPQEIYNRPANTFTASFIGSPAMNLFHAQFDGNAIRFGDQRLTVTNAAAARYPGLAAFADKAVIVGIRPEDMNDLTLVPHHPADQVFSAMVKHVESLGSDLMAHLVVNATAAVEIDPDMDAEAQRPPEIGKTLCVARFGAQSTCVAGQEQQIAVHGDRLHFFDPATGAALSR